MGPFADPIDAPVFESCSVVSNDRSSTCGRTGAHPGDQGPKLGRSREASFQRADDRRQGTFLSPDTHQLIFWGEIRIGCHALSSNQASNSAAQQQFKVFSSELQAVPASSSLSSLRMQATVVNRVAEQTECPNTYVVLRGDTTGEGDGGRNHCVTGSPTVASCRKSGEGRKKQAARVLGIAWWKGGERGSFVCRWKKVGRLPRPSRSATLTRFDASSSSASTCPLHFG